MSGVPLSLWALRSEHMFSQLGSAWYNISISNKLMSNRVYCWVAITAYYATLHSARTILFVSDNVMRFYSRRLGLRRGRYVILYPLPKVFSRHLSFIKLLINNDYPLTCVDEVSSNELQRIFGIKDLGQIRYGLKVLSEVKSCLKIDSGYLKEVGERLRILKNVREAFTYIHVVIAHQIRRHTHFIEEISGKTCDIALDTVCNLTSIIVDNYLLAKDTIPEGMKPYFLKHFLEEVDQCMKLIKKERGVLPSKLNNLLEEVKDKVSDEITRYPFDNELYRKFMEYTYTRYFDFKARTYRTLEGLLCELNKIMRGN